MTARKLGPCILASCMLCMWPDETVAAGAVASWGPQFIPIDEAVKEASGYESWSRPTMPLRRPATVSSGTYTTCTTPKCTVPKLPCCIIDPATAASFTSLIATFLHHSRRMPSYSHGRLKTFHDLPRKCGRQFQPRIQSVQPGFLTPFPPPVTQYSCHCRK